MSEFVFLPIQLLNKLKDRKEKEKDLFFFFCLFYFIFFQI